MAGEVSEGIARGVTAVQYNGVQQVNQFVYMDALDFCRSLPDESVDCWWSSPPYNLGDPFRGGRAPYKGGPKFQYGADGPVEKASRGDGSLLPEGTYQDQQVAILDEWARTLKRDGVAFYLHKNRHKDGRLITPYEWIFRSKLTPIGEVVWDRRGSPNVDTRRFLPTSERVYILARRPGVKLNNTMRYGDVIAAPPTHHKRSKSRHPAPAHPGIVRLCLQMLPWRANFQEARIGDFSWAIDVPPLVADCYAGIGTTGIVAVELGMQYLLCDNYQPYVDAGIEKLGKTIGPGPVTYLPMRQLAMTELLANA